MKPLPEPKLATEPPPPPMGFTPQHMNAAQEIRYLALDMALADMRMLGFDHPYDIAEQYANYILTGQHPEA